MSRKVEKVAIVGRDAAAWIAALALQRAFGRTGVHVEVVELPSLLRPVDAFAAVSSLSALHALLGIDEEDLIAACAAVPIVAQRFSNWARSRPPFLHGYDSRIGPPEGIDFLHYWVKARAQGLRVELEDFSLAASAAKQGRLPREESELDGTAPTPGYHLDALPYVAFLGKRALAAGVGHRTGTIAGVERDGDRIAAVLLDDGARVEADLFIDACGASAPLIRDMPGSSFTSWREWFGTDRILAASGPRLKTLPSFSQISAFRGGWIGLHPLQDRTAVTAVWDSGAFPEEDLKEALPTLCGMPIAGEAVITPFEAGLRPKPWIGNCVALGEAAVNLEPLDAVQLHLIHIAVSHLVTFFPVDAADMPEAPAYNEAVARHAENVRDFQLVHYRLNQRFDEPFWDRARDSKGPASLDARISLFSTRGEVILYDHESFQEQNWAALFVGHGLVPKGYDVRIDRVPPQEHMMRVQQRLRTIADQVKAMPTVEDYLAENAKPVLEFF